MVGRGIENRTPNLFRTPNFHQRDCPLSGVKADIDLTLILPLGMARGCPGVSRGKGRNTPAVQGPLY